MVEDLEREHQDLLAACAAGRGCTPTHPTSAGEEKGTASVGQLPAPTGRRRPVYEAYNVDIGGPGCEKNQAASPEHVGLAWDGCMPDDPGRRSALSPAPPP